jgi:hypothetical protein
MLDKLKEIGFSMHEVMEGTYSFVSGAGPAGEFLIRFEIDWGPDSIMDFVNPTAGEEVFGVVRCQGEFTAEQLVENAPCTGTLELSYISEQKLRYTLDFSGPDGKEYRYIGEKVNLRPWNLHKTHTTCYGTIYEKDTNKEVSTSTTFFKFKTIPSFIASFRLKV